MLDINSLTNLSLVIWALTYFLISRDRGTRTPTILRPGDFKSPAYAIPPYPQTQTMRCLVFLFVYMSVSLLTNQNLDTRVLRPFLFLCTYRKYSLYQYHAILYLRVALSCHHSESVVTALIG